MFPWMLTKFISLIFMSGRYLNKTNEKKRKFWDSQQKKKKKLFLSTKKRGVKDWNSQFILSLRSEKIYCHAFGGW